MARRKAAETSDPSPMPAELQSRPTTPDEVARWVPVGEDPPPRWSHELYPWRIIAAHRRWTDARHAWCDENGLDYVDTFHPDWRRRGAA